MNGPAPPGNANAPLAKGRRDRLTGGRGYAACPHSATITERFPGGVPHYSHEVCVACGRHLRWHPKPRNVERRKLLAAQHLETPTP
jgi:hypothetical protein